MHARPDDAISARTNNPPDTRCTLRTAPSTLPALRWRGSVAQLGRQQYHCGGECGKGGRGGLQAIASSRATTSFMVGRASGAFHMHCAPISRTNAGTLSGKSSDLFWMVTWKMTCAHAGCMQGA